MYRDFETSINFSSKPDKKTKSKQFKKYALFVYRER